MKQSTINRFHRVLDLFRKHTVSRIPWNILDTYQIGGRS